MSKRRLVLIVHNVRSSHNVGSILRSADGLGASKVYLSGFTPYPPKKIDVRLPHIQKRIEKQIHKTALGAEKSLKWAQTDDLPALISKLKEDRFLVAALEQLPSAVPLNSFKSNQDIALIVGNELTGIDDDILKLCDIYLQIPMLGSKESFNVAVAASISLYHLSYYA
jgi:23S rRNA (guanosine2251-2'-O)-methyltransferase